MRHQVDRRVARVVEIDGRRYHAITHRKYAEDRLDGPRRAQQVPDRRLGRGHAYTTRGIAEQPFDGIELDFIAQRRRSAVRIDVIDLAGGYTSPRDRSMHAA